MSRNNERYRQAAESWGRRNLGGGLRGVPVVTATSSRLLGGGPIVWITPENMSNRRPRRDFTSLSTIALRRLLIRPISVIIFGACLLQATSFYGRRGINQSNSQAGEHRINSWLMGWGSVEDQTMISLGEPHQQELSSSKNTSKPLLDMNMLKKQQIPTYPKSWMTKGAPATSQSKESHNESTDEASPGVSDAAPNNPQLYGWEPTVYPNPIYDPVRCGVAYIDQDEQVQQSAVEETINEPNTVTSTEIPVSGNRNKLRLCDPDWVLGGMYLEEIAAALHEFSLLYGDIVAKSKPSSTDGDRPLLRNRLLNEEFRINGGDGIFLSSNGRHPSSLEINRRTQENITSEAYPPDHQDIGSEPIVQLAVATVRKVTYIHLAFARLFLSFVAV